MKIGFLRGNHTFVSFKSCDQAIIWLNEASHDDIYPLEMAFMGDTHLHKEYKEHDIDWVRRCISLFGPKPINVENKYDIQEYLIP